ncbi:hypothetical protein RDn1_108 [Candidatus Termititenax dinenymphae]|uniref:Uncharacterized protein n=1 Tax=Candidatus Termititenax dinenymphae TaxID=2218523 RepID=A0A388TJJ4_9BACT|nr:hypothetical protein RDn1_108 [Candidatus Termititenax dinenymphae]
MVMAILENFDEPENGEDKDLEYTEYLSRYYGDALADMFNSNSAAEQSEMDEVFPYEVLIFSEQPGILRIK